jgi:hypothetical protein
MLNNRKCALLILTAVSTVSLSRTNAQTPPCDLSTLAVAKKYLHSFPFGNQSISTETRILLAFQQTPNGDITVERTSNTYLLLIGEKIASQIDALKRQLPNNRCGQKASISSRDARVTPPTFTITVTADASLNGCAPDPPVRRVPAPCPPRIIPRIPPEICWQDLPRPSALPPWRIAAGDGRLRLVPKSGFVDQDNVKVTLEPYPEFHLDNQTNFLIHMLFDPIIAHFVVDGINSAMTDFINKPISNFLPGFERTISINGRDEVIDCKRPSDRTALTA